MNDFRSSNLVIRTPEGISFSWVLACPVTRCLAWAIDLAVIAAAGTVIGGVLALFSLLSFDLGNALKTLFYFIIQIGYGIACEWFWRGQTVGKRIMRLRVMDAQGLCLQPNQVVDLLPACYMVGGVASILNSRGQRLGDFVANTIVVRNPKLSEPNLEQLMSGKYNSLRDYPYLEARLRQRVTPLEARLALQALLRRDDLELQARVALFDQMAEHFRSLVPFPPEAWEGITAEQYIRNVVDILFRTDRSRQTAR
jgi:uncharacterized RDD family membrane protein YckC